MNTGLHAGLTRRIIESAIHVHRVLGPGLLESTYRKCLLAQLGSDGMAVESEVAIPIRYESLTVESAYRADVIVERSVLLELKAVDHLMPIHEAQVLTYLRHTGLRVGLLVNFNSIRLVSGIRRLVR